MVAAAHRIRRHHADSGGLPAPGGGGRDAAGATGFDDWPATSNRETDQRPVHLLREYAKTLGLVRKYKGKLVRTNLGTAMADNATQMWRHLLERLPLGTEQIEREAGYLVLLTLAAGTSSDERRDVIAEGLAALGWQTSDGTIVGREEVFWMGRPTISFLELIGAMVEATSNATSPWTRMGSTLRADGAVDVGR